MKQIFNYHERLQFVSWIMKKAEVLLEQAVKNKDSSFVLYACLECRNAIEKFQFDILAMATEDEELEGLKNLAKGKDGLEKTNKKYKTLRFRYQSFNAALIKALFDLDIKRVDMEKSDELEKYLSDYIHTYTKTQEEMNFNSSYIQNGITKCRETIQFINSHFVKTPQGLTYGAFSVNSGQGSMKELFNEWKTSVEEDEVKLYNRIVEIRDTEFKDQKPVRVLKKSSKA